MVRNFSLGQCASQLTKASGYSVWSKVGGGREGVGSIGLCYRMEWIRKVVGPIGPWVGVLASL